MKSLVLEPLIPAPLWTALLVLAVGLLVWYARSARQRIDVRRWWLLIGLMSASLALPLIVLLNPTWIEQLPPPEGKPLLTVLVDATVSMKTQDAVSGSAASSGAPQLSRFEYSGRLARQFATDLNHLYDVRIKTFDDRSRSVEPGQLAGLEPAGLSTDLAAAISEALAEDQPQGQALLLLSDGIHNAPGATPAVLEAASRSKAMAAPIFTKTVGGPVTVRDLAVGVRTPMELTYVGQRATVAASLEQHGLDGRSVRLTLMRDETVLAERQAKLTTPRQEVLFEIGEDKPGIYRYAVRAGTFAEEVSDVNNQTSIVLRVVDQPVRVLMLEGKPYWDTKFFIRTLSADPSMELTAVVRLAPNRFLQRTLRASLPGAAGPASPVIEPPTEAKPPEAKPAEAAPATTEQPAAGAAVQVTKEESWRTGVSLEELLPGAEALSKFQVIVLGRDAETLLDEAAVARLKRWIRQDGGSLVCYRGAPAVRMNQDLARMMPVRWTPARESRFRLRMTPSGEDLHWIGGAGTMNGLPALASAARAEQPQPLAVVLATRSDGDEPAVTYQPYGAGQVVAVEGAGMWRWAFLAPKFQEQQAAYGSLWRSVMRWLVSRAGLLPGQDMALQTDRVTYPTTDPVSATLLVREDLPTDVIPSLELTNLSRPAEPKTIFKAAPVGDEPGVYRYAFGKLPEGRYAARAAVAAAAPGTPVGDPPAGDPAAAEGKATRGNLEVAFDVRRDLREQVELSARPDLMARIALESHGAVLEGNSSDEVVQAFNQHLERIMPPRQRRVTAWDRWWVLLAVLGLWCASWGVRRSSGLI